MRPPSVSTSSATRRRRGRRPSASETSSRSARASAIEACRPRRWIMRPVDLVVLVLDVADDHLDQVLDRDQAVGAAVFVDHQRHVDAGRLHLHQQIDGRHRAAARTAPAAGSWRRRASSSRSTWPRLGGGSPLAPAAGAAGFGARGDDSRGSPGCGPCPSGRRGSRDRPAGANGRPSRNRLEQFGERRCSADRDDVGARHHDVVDADAAEAEHVLEHRPLLRREVRRPRRSRRARPRGPRGSSRGPSGRSARQQSVVPARRAPRLSGDGPTAGAATSIFVHGSWRSSPLRPPARR